MRGGATKIAECGVRSAELQPRAVWKSVTASRYFFRVFKFAINRLRAAFQRGFELWEIADENELSGTRVTRVNSASPNFVGR